MRKYRTAIHNKTMPSTAGERGKGGRWVFLKEENENKNWPGAEQTDVDIPEKEQDGFPTATDDDETRRRMMGERTRNARDKGRRVENQRAVRLIPFLCQAARLIDLFEESSARSPCRMCPFSLEIPRPESLRAVRGSSWILLGSVGDDAVSVYGIPRCRHVSRAMRPSSAAPVDLPAPMCSLAGRVTMESTRVV